MRLKAVLSFLPDLDRSRLRSIVLALLIGLVGGACFAYAGLPLPWMLGAMAATTGASLAGAEVALPQRLRQPMIAVVGVTLGSAFTPERLESVGAWLLSLAVLPIYVAVVGGLVLLYLRRMSAFDAKTAFFAATPGGLSEMIILSDRLGADMRNVALFHAARLVLIVFSIPILTSLFVTVESVSAVVGASEGIVASDLLVLGFLLVAGWLLALPLRLPSPSFMGPLFLSSAVHLVGLTEASPPFVLVAAAQLVIGTSVGCRFSGIPFRLILKTLTIGAGGALLMFVVTILFALGLYAVTGHPLALLILALIPGGFPEMSLIALGMGFDPAFVVTHHGLRVLLVVVFALPVYTWLKRRGWFAQHWPREEAPALDRPPATDGLLPPDGAERQATSSTGGRSARK